MRHVTGVRFWRNAAVVAAFLTGPSSLQGRQQDTTRWTETTLAGELVVEVVASGIPAPSSIAFLPDGRLLVSERRAGALLLVDPADGAAIRVRGLPVADTVADAGTLDVELHPQYAQNGWIYLSYAVRRDSVATTVLDRFRLAADSVVNRERLFEAQPWIGTGGHHGGRLAFHEGYLFMTAGDREIPRHAQDPSTHPGKILRLHDDGRVPADNPFAGRPGALPEIWSMGHRNPQGLAVEPGTNRLWSHEHGPRGGDELQLIVAGRNYGWPVITWGIDYDGRPIGEGLTTRDGLSQPEYYWVPSIAPSGMVFLTSAVVPRWQGSLFLGALAGRSLHRVVLTDVHVRHDEQLFGERRWRVREVAEGPDGLLYLGVDGGMVLRVRPAT
jgi:aldose sugar dehydrogenase